MSEISRNARVQALYRDVNEGIALINAGWDSPTLEVLCECGAAGCTQRIVMTSTDYESMRSHPTRFALVPGHENGAVEHVVSSSDAFLLVENHGSAATIAERTDPRAAAR